MAHEPLAWLDTADGWASRARTAEAERDALRVRVGALEAALRQIVDDWDSVSPSTQVPDEINVDAHWDAARAALAGAPPAPEDAARGVAT